MCKQVITCDLENLVSLLKPRIQPWRTMTIVVDGVDYSGKSTLSRFLSWQLSMPTIETDLAFINSKDAKDNDPPVHDVGLINRLIKMRHDMNRPVIVEGVFMLKLFDQLHIQPEILIRASCVSSPRTGSWPIAFAKYVREYPRSTEPDYKYEW